MRELDFNGVYRLRPNGEPELLVRDQSRPNGIAFSPDEQTLYVATSDAANMSWMAYDLDMSGASSARVFYDANDQTAPGAADGMKVDTEGHLYVAGATGIWVFEPSGTLLGVIATPELPTNCAWGDDDRKTLYITARTSLFRIRVNVPGLGVGGV